MKLLLRLVKHRSKYFTIFEVRRREQSHIHNVSDYQRETHPPIEYLTVCQWFFRLSRKRLRINSGESAIRVPPQALDKCGFGDTESESCVHILTQCSPKSYPTLLDYSRWEMQDNQYFISNIQEKVSQGIASSARQNKTNGSFTRTGRP